MEQWIPVIGAVVLGLGSLATVAVRAIQTRRTLKVMLQSLPLDAESVDLEISDGQGTGVHLTLGAKRSREGGARR